ncbi:plastocyanin [Rhodococcus sp. 27YEA15]|uniref:plastocyanin/azurin family copper-binding protein n=1 Tax=Rhodococcus sp. 27YEA15 TaxID=3156259 RepID=UPI003C7D3283
MKSRLGPMIAALAVALALTGCTSTTDSSEPEAPVSGPVVTVTAMAYSPASITVDVGDTVTWVFDDNGMAHDVNGLGSARGKLRSPLKKSGTYTHTFTEAGTYDYTCTPHPEMRGTVVVNTP